MIGCECATCTSTDPRDRRSRASILLQGADGQSVLVDTTPDLRSQALAHNVRRVDAIVYTHSHADHVMGLDDVRRFNVLQRSAIPCYGDERTLADLRRIYSYIFDRDTPPGGGIPQVVLTRVAGEFCVGSMTIVPVPLMHGSRTILGYRLGSFAYLTDCSGIPDASWPLLTGVRTLILDALRERPHPTHLSLAQALAIVGRLAPERAYFTHMCHDLPHAETCARLPAGVELAYDGLAFEVAP
ncbi:MAG: MBL fold metallo-hydrolase [Acidobacteria bacterium]|nr:MBL fold metallo-hydrolase [Acidobacteriota bacterium]